MSFVRYECLKDVSETACVYWVSPSGRNYFLNKLTIGLKYPSHEHPLLEQFDLGFCLIFNPALLLKMKFSFSSSLVKYIFRGASFLNIYGEEEGIIKD